MDTRRHWTETERRNGSVRGNGHRRSGKRLELIKMEKWISIKTRTDRYTLEEIN
jgi:hypothetical protein